jgi:hypothetical protein
LALAGLVDLAPYLEAPLAQMAMQVHLDLNLLLVVVVVVGHALIPLQMPMAVQAAAVAVAEGKTRQIPVADLRRQVAKAIMAE